LFRESLAAIFRRVANLDIRYTLEILPFALRARGFAIFSFSVSLSVIFNQYINPILLEKYAV